jgi:hypothetical protein
MAYNVPSFYDVCWPAARQVGTSFCVSKNRDKGKCGRGEAETQGALRRRCVKTLLADGTPPFVYYSIILNPSFLYKFIAFILSENTFNSTQLYPFPNILLIAYFVNNVP